MSRNFNLLLANLLYRLGKVVPIWTFDKYCFRHFWWDGPMALLSWNAQQSYNKCIKTEHQTFVFIAIG